MPLHSSAIVNNVIQLKRPKLHRTQVQFPASTCWLTTVYISALEGGDLTLSSGLFALHACDVQTYMKAQTPPLKSEKIIF